MLLSGNAGFHHSESAKEYATEAGIEPLFVPAYSFWLTPIEGVPSVPERHCYVNGSLDGSLASTTPFFEESFSALNNPEPLCCFSARWRDGVEARASVCGCSRYGKRHEKAPETAQIHRDIEGASFGATVYPVLLESDEKAYIAYSDDTHDSPPCQGHGDGRAGLRGQVRSIRTTLRRAIRNAPRFSCLQG